MNSVAVMMRNPMARKAAFIGIRNEDWSPTDTQCVRNFAAASAILMKIAARIDARKAAANSAAPGTAMPVESSIDPITSTRNDRTDEWRENR